MISPWLHYRDDRRGATAIEFAMMAGPLLLLLAGSVEFGRVYWAKQVLNEAAIAGARCMALPELACSTAGAYDAAKSKAYVVSFAGSRGVTVATASVSLDRAATCSGVAGFSRVDMSVAFATPLPLLGSFLEDLQLNAEACFPTYSS